MPKSLTKTRPRTLNALLDSARTLFIENGYHATSISDICEQAGLTRGAFYSNYRSKDQLFLRLYDVETDNVLAGLEQAFSEVATSADALARLAHYVDNHRGEHRQWFLVSMEFTLHAARNPAIAAELASREDRLTAGMAKVLAPLIPHATPAYAHELARLLTALHEGSIAQELIHGHSSTAFEHRLTYRFLAALVAEK
jgi:AcrR family transcriptional regulator